jgi:hypothetical protein
MTAIQPPAPEPVPAPVAPAAAAPAPAPVPPPAAGTDEAEALLVTVGLEPFIKHSSRDLGSAIERAGKLPEAIEAQIYRFLGRSGEDTEPAPELPPFDYEETVKLLDTPPKPGQAGKTMAAFGDHHDLGFAVGTEVTRIVEYLRTQIPRRTRVGLTGPHDLPPARSEEFRFRRCWRLALDPMSIFADLQAFSVSRDEVTCFTEMFPTTAKTFWPTIQRAVVRKRVQVDGWEPHRRQELQLRVLGQQEGPLLVLAHALVAVYAAEAQQQKAQEQQPTTKDVSAADESTAIQRLDQG